MHKFYATNVRIVYSPIIDSSSFNLLKELTPKHLEQMKESFKVVLTPKQHNMTHMHTSISMVGPLVHMSTLKFEMKHKEFSSDVRKMQNFKNVSQSLAKNYQMKSMKKCYKNQIKIGRRTRSKMTAIYHNFVANFDHSKLFELKSLKHNSHYYEKGLFIKDNELFYKIENILSYESEYYFFCIEYTGIKFDEFLNSLSIAENIPKIYKLLCHSKMLYKKSHLHRQLENSLYIIAETIEINI